MNLTEKEKNKLVRQYDSLILKLTNQFGNSLPSEFIRSDAEYGFAYAINTYRDNTSQTFTQYAAWCMRNFILNGIKKNHDSMVDYKEEGEISKEECKISYDANYDYDIDTDRLINKIRNKIEGHFDKRRCDMLYHTMSLFGYKHMTLRELSDIYKISQPGIKQMNDRILKYVKSDPEIQSIISEMEVYH